MEGDRHDGRRNDRERQVRSVGATDQRTDSDHDSDIDGGDESREGAEYQRLVDDKVDVVEPVLHHRDRDTDRQGRNEQRQGPVLNLLRNSGTVHQEGDDKEDAAVQEPLELLPLLTSGAPESHDKRRQCPDDRDNERDDGKVFQIR